MSKQWPIHKSIRYGSMEWWGFQAITLLSFYLLFVFGRVIFILWNLNSIDASAYELMQTFLYGFRLDISMSAYATFVLFLFSPFLFGNRRFQRVYGVITGIILIILLALIFSDAELYTYWGYKIDSSVLKYLLTPKEALASLSVLKRLLLGALAIFVVVATIVFVRRVIPSIKLTFNRFWQLNGLLVLPIIILLARGSIDVSAVNASTAFFSQKQILNHTAINAPWNFASSFFMTSKDTGTSWNDSLAPYLLRFQANTDSTISILNRARPNLVIVVMESFTANLFDFTVEGKTAIPNLKRIASEGYFFSNCYATGNRSDKGLGALFAGYPAHPQGSILQHPERYGSIGQFASQFVEANYQTRFYYGGNSDFANFKGFLISNGFEKVVEQSDFPVRQRTSKWGIHDDMVMDRFFNDIQDAQDPLLYGVFSLSSHEPFDVPYHSSFLDDSKVGDYLNSVAFTDSVFGQFYDRFKNSSKWDNTIIVFVADHGHYFPLKSRMEEPSHYRIPFIIAGGALKKEFRNQESKQLMSQIDVPLTLLNQWNLPAGNFPFSRNFLTQSYSAPIEYTFNYGYGLLTPNADTVVMDVGGNRLFQYGLTDSVWVNASNAWFQNVLRSFGK